MKKIIFVNNPAAKHGGALTILKEFIIEAAQKCRDDFLFYIFCTADLQEYETENVKIVNDIKVRSWKERIYWDMNGLKKWSTENKIKPNLIISLQNTGVFGFKKIPKIIYLHQSIPYYKEFHWNPFKKQERIYWFYKHIYKQIIHHSVKGNVVVLQTEWMKQRVIKEHKLNEKNLFVIRPKISVLKVENQNEVIDANHEVKLFYPAAPEIYKNHKILIEAMKELKSRNKELNFHLYLTIDKKHPNVTELVECIERFQLDTQVSFVGQLSYKDVVQLYIQCDIVLFPSYLETFGLPLLEAAYLNKKIVAADLEYSREVLKNYNGVNFAEYNNPLSWENEILNAVFDQKKRKLDFPKYQNETSFIRLIKDLSRNESIVSEEEA